VLEGLSGSPKSIPAQHLFDDTGTRLARAILETPEYYLSRVEREIVLRNRRDLVADMCAQPCDVVDLAPSDALETRILLESFRERDARYVPMASSNAALADVTHMGGRALAWLPMFPVRAEGFAAIAHLNALDPSRRRLVLLLGSHIGQLERPDALTFLRGLHDVLRPGDRMLISFDFVKDASLLENAYADAEGLQRQLSFNILARLNRELNGQFGSGAFGYRARFCPVRQAVISELVSTRAQSVRVGHFRHEFAEAEPIQTQLACKFRQSEIAELSKRAGFFEKATVTDERRFMQVSAWSVEASA